MEKSSVESVVSDFAHADLLPTVPGTDLDLDEVIEKLCGMGELPFASGELGDDGKSITELESTTGGLVLLRAIAPTLATLFKRAWSSIDVGAVSVTPRAVVQRIPNARGVSHYVLFTERPHYPCAAYNPDGNRCALHCALMAIGVTDAWQRHSPHAGSQRRPERPSLTRYDDYPQKKELTSRQDFANALRAHSGEDAYAYVLCDTEPQFEAPGVTRERSWHIE